MPLACGALGGGHGAAGRQDRALFGLQGGRPGQAGPSRGSAPRPVRPQCRRGGQDRGRGRGAQRGGALGAVWAAPPPAEDRQGPDPVEGALEGNQLDAAIDDSVVRTVNQALEVTEDAIGNELGAPLELSPNTPDKAPKEKQRAAKPKKRDRKKQAERPGKKLLKALHKTAERCTGRQIWCEKAKRCMLFRRCMKFGRRGR